MKTFARYVIKCAVAALLAFPMQAAASDNALNAVLNATFRIEKKAVSLVDGYAESPTAPGSAAIIVTKVIGTPVFGDLNGDGQGDAALFLMQETGAAVVFENGTWHGTDALFLGDCIGPRAIRIDNGVITAEHTDRKLEQALSEAPLISKTVHLFFNEGRLEIKRNK